ncbi:hypothetical protein O5O45_26615 [Hahella aquimaris]|uniref:hypothetical protein n=1 Tax=Hahella sp. HNIBRBA332 TaxID=3015983 RepID=UPI00273B2EC3|nr:hypothetical protein [Hahella sp. HNIBRBA332]WLQ13300.1 hypothetical protein O5O45_26615 [Hahella sp. HNIBRBA332]
MKVRHKPSHESLVSRVRLKSQISMAVLLALTGMLVMIASILNSGSVLGGEEVGLRNIGELIAAIGGISIFILLGTKDWPKR